MRRILSRNAPILAWIAVLALSGGFAAAGQAAEAPPADPPAAEPSESLSPDEALAQARGMLIDLLASEHVERIDYQAETYEEAMNNIQITANTILRLAPADAKETMRLANQAGQVIEAIDAHKPRGVVSTFGADVRQVTIKGAGDARLLGDLVRDTVSLIREQYGDLNMSYKAAAGKLLHSVILDADEGAFLLQYVDGIQLIADLPPERRDRYFR